jgi:hypothetical protein
MSWASGRQSKYFLGVLIFVGLVFLVILYPTLTKAPTCSDGKQNGGEAGVDCGGSCRRVCNSQASEPIILWSRAFNITGSSYNLLAMVENQNKDAGIEQVSYEFKVYDTNNLLIGVRDGTTFIPPNQQFAIFEPRFDAGKAQVKSVIFQFTSPFVWLKEAPTLQTMPIPVDHIAFSTTPTPTLTAQINNETIYTLPAFDVIAILYDANHNAINVSKTYITGMQSNSTAPLLFTWPNTLGETPVTQDILVQINPFTTGF